MQEEINWTIKCMNGVLLDSHSPSHWLLFKGAFLSVSFSHQVLNHHQTHSSSWFFLENLLPLLLFLGSSRCFTVWNRNTVLEPTKWSEKFQSLVIMYAVFIIPTYCLWVNSVLMLRWLGTVEYVAWSVIDLLIDC